MFKTRNRQRGLAGTRRRGQGLVEMAIITPLILVLAMGTLEVGLLLSGHYNALYAVREASRIGAFARCLVDPATGFSPDDAVLLRLGAALKGKMDPGDIWKVEIYKADPSGNISGGLVNTYKRFVITGTTSTILTPTVVEADAAKPWKPRTRGDNPLPNAGLTAAPWLGVRMYYTHTTMTFVGKLMGPNGQLSSSERSVMRIEPAPDPTSVCGTLP